MKNLVLTFYFSLSTSFIFSQAPAIEWQNTIGGSNYEYLRCVARCSDGGYFLAGYTGSNISGDKTENIVGYEDYWIVKINSTGNIVWQNDIGGTQFDELYSVSATSDGGCFLVGASNSPVGGDKTEPNGLLDWYDFWVIKISPSGAIQWQNTIGGYDGDYGYSGFQTADGGYIIAGLTSSGATLDKTEPLVGNYDYWILKLNSSGTIVWQNDIGGTYNDYLMVVRATSDGGYILGGYSTSIISGDKTEATNGANDFWIVKVNSSGTIVWQNTIGGSGDDVLYDIQPTADGGYIATGYSSSGISGDKTEALIGVYDYWVVKLNSSGAVVWQNTLGGTGADIPKTVVQTSDGGYVVGGYSTSGISADKSEANIGNNDIWIVKLNSGGTAVWNNTIGGTGLDNLMSMVTTPDGGFLLGAYSGSGISGDKTEGIIGGGIEYDYWVIKLQGDCIPVTEICNALDDDCDGVADDGIVETCTVTAGGATTFCQGGSVVLTASYTGATIQWKKGGVDIAGATSSTYTATASGTYTATTTSACGTATSTGITVVANKNPNAGISAGGPTTFCPGGSVTLTETAVAGCNYQWYKGATALAGATTTTYVATLSGNYKCRVTKTATGCYKNSNTISVNATCRDAEQVDAKESISIYPNPGNNYCTISGEINSQNAIIEIFDQLGQLIYSKEITTVDGAINETINVEDYARGIYLFKVKDGNYFRTLKFIIE